MYTEERSKIIVNISTFLHRNNDEMLRTVTIATNVHKQQTKKISISTEPEYERGTVNQKSLRLIHT